MTLLSMDYWRLNDELSIIDAAILITGGDPSETEIVYDEIEGRAVFNSDGSFKKVQKTDYEGFDASFKAIRNAVLSNKLSANIALVASETTHVSQTGYMADERAYYSVPIFDGEDRIEVNFDNLIRIENQNLRLFSNRKINLSGATTTMCVIREPNWTYTTVQVEDLKVWLRERGLFPPFFFPEGAAEGFRDSSHPRYAPKLACAVAAWEATKKPLKGQSPKATLKAWITSNGVSFGLGNDSGVVTDTAADEIAKVSNWRLTGGANPAMVKGLEEEVLEINNFEEITIEEDDSEIPF